MEASFHGKLDRKTAEDRLTAFGIFGAYLLRESDRKSGSYVLSFRGKTGINHFKITRVYGSYYIGGRKFESLDELIDFHRQVDLLTEEQLVHPVSPPEPVIIKNKLFVSILPYTALGQDELSFKKETLFIFEHDHGDDWYWCRNVKTGEIGLVFSKFIEEVTDDVDPNEIFPWFHPHLSKIEAVDQLAKIGPGSFLVKSSESSRGNYTLYYHAGNTVQRFQIVRNKDNRYVMGGRYFESLGHIIELYKKEQIIEGHSLKFPVLSPSCLSDSSEEQNLSSSMKTMELRERSEDIYDIVKQNRESAKSKEVRGWLFLKKLDFQKKWKKYYFILNPATYHLYYYEKPQQTKPKGLIDLSYSQLYIVHPSLFDWPQCFQLVERSLPCFSSNFYLRCDDEYENFLRWVKAIQCFTLADSSFVLRLNGGDITNSENHETNNGAESSRSYEPNYVQRRSIKIEFIEVQGLKSTQALFLIYYNHDILIGKASINGINLEMLDNKYNNYEFINIPSDAKSISIALCQTNKKSKSSTKPEISIKLENLEPDRVFDCWFDFPSSKNSEISLRLRLKILFSRDLIMSRSHYTALEELILDANCGILEIFEKIQHPLLARSLVNIFSYKSTIVSTLKILIEREVSLQDDCNSLFSNVSFVGTMLESYIRISCRNVLTKCLKGPIRRLMEIGSLVNLQSACENLENLFVVIDELIQNVYNSVHYYPLPVRYLCAILQRAVQSKWPEETLVRTRVVAGFLFLRLICPTLLKPKLFGLVNKSFTANPDQKKLALVTAKCLENLANIVDSTFQHTSLCSSVTSTLNSYSNQNFDSSKTTDQEEYAQADYIVQFILTPQIEEWMDVLQPVILKKKLGLVKFVDELCDVDLCDPSAIDELAIDDNNNTTSSINQDKLVDWIADDLATVHSVCEAYKEDIEQLSSHQITNKLLKAISNLTQRRSYYLSGLK